jgi:hypothetical protein
LKILHIPTANINSVYKFESNAEADATFLVIAYFAVTESASLGIFPLLSVLEISRKQGTPAMLRFFEHGIQHFTDEQHHATLWCGILQDFARQYPEVVERVNLPNALMKVMLKSIGKPHTVTTFTLDCLAFETVMKAFYDVAYPRLSYPPLAPMFRLIMADEVAHTGNGETYLHQTLKRNRGWQYTRLIIRFWRNIAGVLITLLPLLDKLNRLQPGIKPEFKEALISHVQQVDLAGCRKLVPSLIKKI